jgi:HlyD family secretion protein
MPAKKSSGRWKWLVIVLLVGGALAGWRWYAKKPAGTAPDYKTITASKGDITQIVTANGQLSAVKNVTVGSQVSGIITDIKVDYNALVTNGQVIAQIDPSTYQQNITQSEAELANAKAALELAQLNMGRATELRKNQLISASEYDKTLVELHQAEAVVRLRDASLKKSNVDLERTTIYSPIDGIVISRVVDVGQTVAASFNAPTLFSIANDLHNMRIEAMVSEADVGGVQEGQRVNFSVEAFPGRQFRGEVTQVRYAPVTNQNVVNYTCVVEVNNADLKLRPGMTANASIVTAQRREVLRIPNSALRFRPPEGASVLTDTNAPAKAKGSATNTLASSQDGGGSSAGPGEGGEGSSREERRRRFENMTPEQREEMRARFRARSGDGSSGGGMGGPGRSGGGPRSSQEGPVTAKIYLVQKDAAGGDDKTVLKPVLIKTGISDGVYTEVIDGVNEGDVVVSGLNIPAGTPSAANVRPGSSPFGGPFGGGGMRGR